MLRDNAVLKKMIATGEERVGKIATQLLSNEKLMGALQRTVTAALEAKGVVERNREQPSLILTRVFSVEQAQRELTRGLVLSFLQSAHTPQHVEAVARILQRAPGPCPVYLAVQDAAGKRSLLRSSQDYWINPAKVATGELETLLGPGRVKFTGPANGNGR